MKKTILMTLAALGLTGMTQAETLDWAAGFNPLEDSTTAGGTSSEGSIPDTLPGDTERGWWIGGNYTGGHGNNSRFVHENGVLSTTGSINWNAPVAWYNLGETYKLSQSDTLHFSITYEMLISGRETQFTVALVGSKQAIVMGTGYYDQSVQYGITNETNPTIVNPNNETYQRGYSFVDATGTEVRCEVDSLGQLCGPTTQVPITIDATIAWSEEANGFQLSISANDGDVFTTNLGSDVDISRLTFMADQSSWDPVVNVTDMSLQVTPEPTTATLSLLALAGLCARRRRK